MSESRPNAVNNVEVVAEITTEENFVPDEVVPDEVIPKTNEQLRIKCEVICEPEFSKIAVVSHQKISVFLLWIRMILCTIKINVFSVIDKIVCLCSCMCESFWRYLQEVFVNQINVCSCLTIKCRIEDRPITLLIDTGSQVSVIGTSWYRRWNNPPQLLKFSSRLRSVGGSCVHVKGVFDGKLALQGQLWDIPWVVADIGSSSFGVDGILGIDALVKMHGILDLEKKELILSDAEVKCQEVPARIIGACTLESGRSMKIGVNPPKGLSIFEPDPKLKEDYPGLLVARVVADEYEEVAIPVINTTGENVDLPCGIGLGNWESIEVSQEVVKSEKDENDLPAHLTDLFERSSVELSEKEQQYLRQCLIKYQIIFAKNDEDLGRTNLVQHNIEIGEGRPIKQHPRRLPMMMRNVEQEEVDRMLERNIIVPSSSPWASPTVMVKKKDGKIRFCIDYRKLNEITKKDAYPLPRIDDCIDNLDGAKYFCTMDLQSGYWQVMMDPEDQEKTAFCTRSGLYEFKVMPFGLTNAVATFERLMETVLRGLQWNECLVYLDDVIVFGSTFEQTLERLTHVFDRLSNAGLKLKPSKCSLFAEEVNFLGHVISRSGVRTQQSKIEAVQKWPIPQNVKDVRSFLGLAGYYRRFIRNYAKIARPLHRLTSTREKFTWNEECQQSFEALKSALTSAPILGYPRQDGQMILDTDASGIAVGAVLSQKQDDQEVVLAYMSKSLTPAEVNYCVTRKEMLAVVTAVKTWRPYLLGRKVLLRTDNSAVAWAKRIKEPVGQMARWLQELGCLDLEEQHRPGRVHWNADALSRRTSTPCHQCHREDGNCNVKDVSEISCNAAVTEDESTNEEEGMELEPEWTVEELKIEQELDENIKSVLKFMQNGIKPTWSEISSESEQVKTLVSMWDRLVLRDGLLFRKFFKDDGEDYHLQLILPQIKVQRLLEMAHDDPLGGHFGFDRTLKKLGAYYWVGMRKDVKSYCARCEPCMSRKPKTKHHRAPMKMFLTCAPMERVAIDIMGPLDRTAAGNKYILVVTDTFTKFTEAYALRNIEAKTVAKKLVEEWICRYGVMRIIHSDQGRQFESRLFTEVCKILGIRKTRTTAWRPKANGQVERFNRTLGAMLCIYSQEETKYWDKHLPFITSAYRATEHNSTGLTPNLMIFGREVRMPLNLIVKNKNSKTFSGEEYTQQLAQVFEKAYHAARIRLRKNAVIRKRRYDVGSSDMRFRTGESVWLYDPTKSPGKSPKLQAPWKKGWKIKKRIDDIHYVIENSSTSRVVHVDRICSQQN